MFVQKIDINRCGSQMLRSQGIYNHIFVDTRHGSIITNVTGLRELEVDRVHVLVRSERVPRWNMGIFKEKPGVSRDYN